MKQPESLGQSLSSSWRLRDDLCCSASLTSSPAEEEWEKKATCGEIKFHIVTKQNALSGAKSKSLSLINSKCVSVWLKCSCCPNRNSGLLLFCIRCTKSSRVFPPAGFTASVYRKAVWALSVWVTGSHWRTSKPVTFSLKSSGLPISGKLRLLFQQKLNKNN